VNDRDLRYETPGLGWHPAVVAPDLHGAPASADCIGEGPEDLAGAEEALFTLLTMFKNVNFKRSDWSTLRAGIYLVSK
jgi:hypothetical protein